MVDRVDPKTQELISQGEHLRSGTSGRLPKTRELVRESERLIGRRRSERVSLAPMVWIALVVVLVAIVLAYVLWSRM